MAQSEDERKAKARERAAEWRRLNPERVKAYRKSDAAKDSRKRSVAKRPEHYAAKQRAWEAANREHRNERAREAYSRDPEVGRSKSLRHLNRPGVREKVAQRAREAKKRPEVRARLNINKQNRWIRASGGKLSRGLIGQLMLLQRGKCANCNCDLSSSGHQMDHITPLVRGGEHMDRNIQLLCPPCNLKKNAKDPIIWAQEQGRLL